MEVAINTESISPIGFLKQRRDEAREAIFSEVGWEKLSSGHEIGRTKDPKRIPKLKKYFDSEVSLLQAKAEQTDPYDSNLSRRKTLFSNASSFLRNRNYHSKESMRSVLWEMYNDELQNADEYLAQAKSESPMNREIAHQYESLLMRQVVIADLAKQIVGDDKYLRTTMNNKDI